MNPHRCRAQALARYADDPTQYLAVSPERPVISCVVEAAPEVPCLYMTLRVDPRELAALIVETGRPRLATTTTGVRSS